VNIWIKLLIWKLNWRWLNLRSWSGIWRISLPPNIIHFWFLSYCGWLLDMSQISFRRIIRTRHPLKELILKWLALGNTCGLLNRLIGNFRMKLVGLVCLMRGNQVHIQISIVDTGQVRHTARISWIHSILRQVVIILLESLVLLLQIWVPDSSWNHLVFVLLGKLLFVHL